MERSWFDWSSFSRVFRIICIIFHGAKYILEHIDFALEVHVINRNPKKRVKCISESPY